KADSSFAIDNQTVISRFIYLDSSSSTDLFLLSSSAHQVEFAVADLDAQEKTTGISINRSSSDSSHVLPELQFTFNILSAIDADASVGFENQLILTPFFYGTDNALIEE